MVTLSVAFNRLISLVHLERHNRAFVSHSWLRRNVEETTTAFVSMRLDAYILRLLLLNWTSLQFSVSTRLIIVRILSAFSCYFSLQSVGNL